MSKLLTLLGPLIFITIYLVLFIFIRGNIPDTETLIKEIEKLYLLYGYYLVFIGAFFEGLFPIGMYIPGSTVVLLGAVLSKKATVQFPLVIILAVLGFSLAYCVNYVLGRIGWYQILAFLGLENGIKEAKEKIEKHKDKTILLGYISPSPAAFLSTASGVLKIPFWRFLGLSVVAQLFWGTLWGGIAYIFGMPLVEFILKNLFIIIGFIVVIGIFRSRRDRRGKK